MKRAKNSPSTICKFKFVATVFSFPKTEALRKGGGMENIFRYIGRSFFYLANVIRNAKADVESYLFDFIYVDDHLRQ
jgi:hypothetical protein